MGWVRRRIAVRGVTPSHAVEKGRKLNPKYANDPIYVKPKIFGGYKIHDGNARLQRARAAGQSHIEAWVRK